MPKKPTICLNMIVKNEEHVIEETLASICPYIDDFIINDTGSTDNTIQVIYDFFKKRGINGTVYQNEFREFDYARTTALELCKNSNSEYIWVIDADDIVKGIPEFPENMNLDCYYLQYGKSFTYTRCQIFKNDPEIGWHYVGWVHEYPDSKRSTTSGIIKGCYIESRRLGDRNKNPNKYLNDAIKLEKRYELYPCSRDIFYCANSYYDHVSMSESFDETTDYIRDDEKYSLLAEKWYRKRIAISEFPEERYYSYYRLGQTLERLNRPWEEIEKIYMEGFDFFPIRGTEIVYKIIKHYLETKDFEKAYKFSMKVVDIQCPTTCKLFLHKYVYDYSFPLDFSVILYNTEKYLESYIITEKLIKENPDNQQLKNNMKVIENKIKNIKKKNCLIYLGYRHYDVFLMNLIDKLVMIYDVYILGNISVNNITYNNVVIVDDDNFDLICYDKIFLYDNLGLLDNKILFQKNSKNYKNLSKNIILIQLIDDYCIYYENSIFVTIKNVYYLRNIFRYISCIISKNNISNSLLQNKQDILDINKFTDFTNAFIYNISKTYYFNDNIIFDRYNNINLCVPQYINNENIHIDFKFKYLDKVLKHNNYPELKIYHSNLLENKRLFSSAYQCINKLNLDNPIFNMYKAKYLYLMGKYQDSYKLACTNYPKLKIDYGFDHDYFEDIKDKNIDHLADSFINYQKFHIDSIKNKELENCETILTLTSCKRYDLFKKTVNSFINCSDYKSIDRWICIDDGSSEDDRNKMKSEYPFFNYIFKDDNQKGHIKSMNIIHDLIIKYPNIKYLIHLEDDFQFVCKKDYIKDSIKILNNNNDNIKQVLFNRNYMEVENYKKRLVGGFLKYCDNIRYVIHEHYNPKSKEYNKAVEDYKNKGGLQLYWPHYSFRPSVVDVSVIRNIGLFPNTPHFEMQYAKDYVNLGYKSAFLDNFSCIHIGKKTWEKGENAYNLNNVNQFNKLSSDVEIKIIKEENEVLNNNIKYMFKDSLIQYEIINLKNSLDNLELFKNNKFNYVRKIMNQLYTLYAIFKDMKSEYYLILNNKITFKDDININIDELIAEMKNNNIDCISLSDNIFGGYIFNKKFATDMLVEIENNGLDINMLKVNSNKDIINSININDIMYDIKDELKDKFEFYSQLDYYGYDIKHIDNIDIDNLVKLCLEDEKCVGFNTNGWLKYKIDTDDLCNLYNSREKYQGLYVKKN